METGVRILTASDLQALDTTISTTLGAVGATADGRRFRYVSFGGTSTIAAGLLMVTPAAKANSTALAITATTVATAGQTTANLQPGSRTLVLTNGVTTVTQDEFKDGYLDVNWSGGTFTCRINGNTAATASTGYITVSLEDPLANNANLVPGTDTASIVTGPYAAVTASTTIANPVGVTICSVPNTASVTNYGWVQTGGHCLVQATSGTKGQPASQDLSGTAGFFINTAAGNAETTVICGAFTSSQASSIAQVELNLP